MSRSGNVVTPTAEQQAAVEAVVTYNAVKIEALAGTGKTTAIEFAARAARLPATYVTFNRRNALEARDRFPDYVQCRTAHSLAYAAVGHRFKHRLKLPEPSIAELGAIFRCYDVPAQAGTQALRGSQLGGLAWQTVQRFIKSPDLELAEQHLPKGLYGDGRSTISPVVLSLARRLWHDITNPNGKRPVSHDAYLKQWQLTKPKLPGDIIFFDEAQDADPVMLDVVQLHDASKVFVGDRYQAIYEWRGAVNAMEQISTDITVPLTESFRFGDSIAEVANTYLEALGSPFLLKGSAYHESRVTSTSQPDVVLCRTNAHAVRGIIRTLKAGQRPALVGGTKDIIAVAQGAHALQQGRTTPHPKLARFSNWQQAQHSAATGTDLELASFVTLVDQFGPLRLLWALRRCVEESVADRTYSTGHRAKGREWNRVRIASDFDDADLRDVEELRLLYVAHTRARRLLDRSGISRFPQPSAGGNRTTRPVAPQGRRDPVGLEKQIVQLGKDSSGSRPARHGKRWSASDDLNLIRRYREHESAESIAHHLQRTKVAVVDRLIKKHGIDWRELADDRSEDVEQAAPERFTEQLPGSTTSAAVPNSSVSTKGPQLRQDAVDDGHGPLSPSINPLEPSPMRTESATVPSQRQGEPRMPLAPEAGRSDLAEVAAALGITSQAARERFFVLPAATTLVHLSDQVQKLAKLTWVQVELASQFAGHPASPNFEERLRTVAEALRLTRADHGPDEPKFSLAETSTSAQHRTRSGNRAGRGRAGAPKNPWVRRSRLSEVARSLGITSKADRERFFELPVAALLLHHNDQILELVRLPWVQREIADESAGGPMSRNFELKLRATAESLREATTHGAPIAAGTPVVEDRAVPAPVQHSRPAPPAPRICASCGSGIDIYSGRCLCS